MLSTRVGDLIEKGKLVVAAPETSVAAAAPALGNEGRAPRTRVVAPAGLLDLDHLGAEVPENLRRPRAGQDARKIEDADARERCSGH